MLIRYPTGFYLSSYSEEFLKDKSLTYLISNTDPPRTDLLYAKVPMGVLLLSREPKDTNVINRRKTSFGDLIYTISRATRSSEGNNARQYELGQVLDFNDISGKDVDPMLVSEVTEVQHDTNRLDYSSMGLTEDEQSAIEDVSLAAQIDLTSRLNELKRLRANAEEAINTNQKIINDTTKTIDSLEVTLSEAPSYGSLATELANVEDIIIKLKSRRDIAFIDRDENIALANFYASEASKVIDRLRTVGVLVK